MLQYELSGSADKSINSRKIKKCFKEFNSAAKIKIKQTVSLAFATFWISCDKAIPEMKINNKKNTIFLIRVSLNDE